MRYLRAKHTISALKGTRARGIARISCGEPSSTPWLACLFAVLLAAGTAAPAGIAIAQDKHGASQAAALEQLKRDDLRLAAAGYRLTVANARHCSDLMPATGLVLHSISQYPASWQAAALQVFGPIGPISVEGVIAPSPAAAAGLRPGDGIIALGEIRVDSVPKGADGTATLRDQFEDQLLALPPTGRISLLIARPEGRLQIDLQPVAACRSRFEMVAGKARFARSDGRIIQVSQGLADEITDVELAVVVAHELAHTILKHRALLAPFEHRDANGKGGRPPRDLVRRIEDQADRLAVHLLAQAGIDPREAPRFMRRYGPRFDHFGLGTSAHRTAKARARAMDDEIAGMGALELTPR